MSPNNNSLPVVIFILFFASKSEAKLELELKKFTDPEGNIVIPYTVWSRKKGAGKTIIDHLLKLARETKQIERVVTLSPLTLMATNFHERNGAIQIGLNAETQNFEYSIADTRWEKYMKDAKKWFSLHVG